jgi:hypothetical protein
MDVSEKEKPHTIGMARGKIQKYGSNPEWKLLFLL